MVERILNTIKSVEGKQEQEINFLDKKLWVTYRVENEAFENLPQITQEEHETHQERYGALLGDFAMVNGKMKVIVKAVIQLEPDEQKNYGYWKEGTDEVAVEITNVQLLVKNIQDTYPEYKNLSFIGEFHTHPAFPHEFENSLKPWEPSPNDLKKIALEYANGVIAKDKPFIFSVAGLNEDAATVYEFYKMNQADDGNYSYERILEN